MAIRIPWDRYEVAYLLDLCLQVEAGTLKRSDAISIGSQHLRKRAIDKGVDIDAVFRNENGINMQLAAIRNCYLGKERGLTISKLFREVVELYKTAPSEFQNILQEETKKMQEQSIWQSFLFSLSKTYSEKAINEIVTSLTMLNIFCLKKKIIFTPIKEITKIEEIEALQSILKTPSSIGLHSKKAISGMLRSLSLFHSFFSMHRDTVQSKREELSISNTRCRRLQQYVY